MIFRLIFLLVNISISNVLLSQSMVKIDSVKLHEKFSNIFIDEKENIYGIDENKMVLTKISKNDTLEYKNIIMGEIEFLSVLNETNIILFFKKFNGVEVLSEKLNRKFFLDFNNNPKLCVDNICGSEFDNIWIYDDLENKLIYYNYSKKEKIFETEKLIYIYGIPFKPIKMVSTQNRVWLIAKRGVVEINNHGNINNIFRYKGIENVSVWDGYLVFLLKDKIVLKNDSSVKEIKNTFENYKKIVFNKNKLFVIYEENIDIWEISI